jgi:uncharacterized membrane protein
MVGMFDSPSREATSSGGGSHIPVDLILVAVLTLGAIGAALVPGLAGSPLQVVLGLVFVFVVPGYALVSLLFPASDASRNFGLDVLSGGSDERAAGVTLVERGVLSVGLSLFIIPIVGLVLNFTVWGIELIPTLVSVGVLTLVLTAVAAARRLRLPADQRFRPGILSRGRTVVSSAEGRTETVLNLVLVVGLVVAASGVVFALAIPREGEQFTEFYLLTENESGSLVADDYPTELTRGQEVTLAVGLTNQEHETTDYTVVVEMQRVRLQSDDATILETSQLHQFSATVDHNESWTQQHTVQPTILGDRIRLVYLLYKGNPPANPTMDNAYRSVHVWVNVTAGAVTSQERPIEPSTSAVTS